MRHVIAVIALAASLSARAQIRSGELPIADEPLGVAPHFREAPAAGASRDQFLVVWTDGRNPNAVHLRGARVSRDGEVLDPVGFVIGPARREWSLAIPPVIASDGADFLVAWRVDDRLQLARVTAAGAVTTLPRPPLPGRAALVWTGDAYVLFAANLSCCGSGILAAVFDREGHMVVEPRPVVQEDSSVISMEAAAGAQGVLLTWTQSSNPNVFARMLSFDELRGGVAAGPTVPPQPASDETVSVRSIAGDGEGFLVSWSVWPRNASAPRNRARRLDAGGNSLGDVRELVEAGPEPLWWTGRDFVVPSATGGSLVHLAPNGAEQRVEPFSTSMSIGTIASLDGRTLAVTAGDSMFVELTGVAASPRTLLTQGLPDRTHVSVVWRGDHYLAVWAEQRDTRRLMYGRIGSDGKALDGAGIPLALARNYQAFAASVATDGAGAVITWVEGVRVRVVFVDRQGRIESDVELASADSYLGRPMVHWNGTQYVVVFGTSPGPGRPHMAAVRFGRDGTRIDAQPRHIADRGPWACAIAWTGREYVVFWLEIGFCFPICTPPVSLWSLSVSPDLLPLGAPLELAAPHVSGTPRFGESRAGVAVVWPQDFTHLRAIRIDAGGMLLDPLNGIEIARGNAVSDIHEDRDGWRIVSGADAWIFSQNGAVGPRMTPYPFVPPHESMTVVHGGPAPLLVYRRAATALDTGGLVRARFAVVAKGRVVRP